MTSKKTKPVVQPAPVLCRCGRPAKFVIRATGSTVCEWHKTSTFVCDRIRQAK